MKKFLCIVLIVSLMLFSLVGCDNEKNTDNTTNPVLKDNVVIGTVAGEEADPFAKVDQAESDEPEAFADGETAAYYTPAPVVSSNPVATPVPTKAPAHEEDADSEAEGDYEPSVGMTEYERYNSMSGEQQQAYMESFASVEDFVAWYNAAREEYESGRIEIDGGEINAEDIVGK